MRLNETHRFLQFTPGLSTEEIEHTPSMVASLSYFNEAARAGKFIGLVADIVNYSMPWKNKRKYKTVLIRSQPRASARAGSFWHLDMDVVGPRGQMFAPDWYDMQLGIVSFGDVAETEFLSDPLVMELDDPNAGLYVELAGRIESLNSQAQGNLRRARGCQVVEYTSRDFHRAGPSRNDNPRLVIITVESDHIHC